MQPRLASVFWVVKEHFELLSLHLSSAGVGYTLPVCVWRGGLREEARVSYVVLNWLLLFIIMGNECLFCFLNRGALWPLPQFLGYFGEFDMKTYLT